MQRIRSYLNDERASTAKIAAWYTVSNLFARGIAVLTTPIFTRLLSKAQYGAFSNFSSWISIITILATVDMTQSVARAKYDYDNQMDEYLSSITLFSNLVTLALYIVVELFSDYFIDIFNMEIRYIRFMFIYTLMWPAFSYLQVKHRIYRKYKFFTLLSIGSSILRTLISVLLVVSMEDKLLGRVIGYVVPVTILHAILWLQIVRTGRSFSWDYIKYACMISIPLIPHALSGILLGNSDRIMITRICGEEQNALYSLAYQISLLANVLWTSMNQAWAPWLYDRMNENNKKAIQKKSKIYLGTFAVMIIGILLATPEIILILGGRKYFEARFVMPPVIMGCCFQFVYGMFVNIEIFEKKTFLISIGSVGAALLNIFLNSIYIPRFGYIAAAYTTLVGYAALFTFHFLIVHIKIKKYSDIYDMKFVFGILLMLLLASASTLILLMVNVARYILLGLYTVIGLFLLWKYRAYVKKIIK